MSRPYVALVAAIVSLPLFAAPGGSVDAKFLKEQVRCARTQIKETGRLGACAYKAADKALRKGLPMLDVSACVARFYDRWAKAEARANARYGPGTCRSAVDPLVVEGAIAQAFSRTVAGISGVRFVDMGFAVVDNATNLMWIKTDDAGGVTDWDNAYSWSPDATVGDATRNGTAFTSYLEQLNGCTTSATGYGSSSARRSPASTGPTRPRRAISASSRRSTSRTARSRRSAPRRVSPCAPCATTSASSPRPPSRRVGDQ